MNIADMRTVHSREAYASLQEHFGDKVFETVIRQSIAYAESAESGRSILDSRPDLGRDYLELAAEVLARTGPDGLAAQADAAALGRLSGRLAVLPSDVVNAADGWSVAE